MGMFDNVRCRIALPGAKAEVVADVSFQTKSFEYPSLDDLEIREDGSLWREKCDSRWEDNGDSPLGGYLHQENCRWLPEPLTGELEFYHYRSEHDQSEFLADFDNGKLIGEIRCKLCVGPMAFALDPSMDGEQDFSHAPD